jgi:hypothetical protein
MIRTILSCLFQCVLFLVTFALGSFVLHPFNVRTALAPDDLHTRVFIWDGLLMMLALYLLVLLIEVFMKQVRRAAPWSTIAVALAALVGYLLKFGFLSTDR